LNNHIESDQVRSASSWLLDARILLVALAVGLLIGVCGVGLDRLVHHASRIYASDLYTCIIASIFSYLLMIYEKRRRMILARRMAIAAEVNHHIRNALSAIIYSTAVRRDQSLQATLKDATDRIDWVLTTVLPDGDGRLKWPVQAPQWRPSQWSRVYRVPVR
jgi:Asp-tRNA(Asn)/Glu-tRNA(Gln) amidotransferase A subunit family amidase